MTREKIRYIRLAVDRRQKDISDTVKLLYEVSNRRYLLDVTIIPMSELYPSDNMYPMLLVGRGNGIEETYYGERARIFLETYL